MQSHNSVSQGRLLSLFMMLFSIGGLGIAMLAGAKIVFVILNDGLEKSLEDLPIKVIVIGLAYFVGWITAMLAIRVYGNLVLPFLIRIFIWVCLAGICILYLLILQRLYNQMYSEIRFIGYVGVIISAILALIGLHLILEDHNPRPLAIPILFISFFQLCLIVFRYVFVPNTDAEYSQLFYFTCDLIFIMGMTAFGFLMLARIGILNPIRQSITRYFDRYSMPIRTEE